MQQNEKDNLIKLGKRIKLLRLQSGLTLNKFVFKKGGLTTATWSRLENGLYNVKFSTLIKVSAMLNIKLEELLDNLDLDYSVLED